MAGCLTLALTLTLNPNLRVLGDARLLEQVGGDARGGDEAVERASRGVARGV